VKNDNTLDLNFLALKNQDFKFKIWRREYHPSEKQWDKTIKKYKLPDEQDNYKDYWVSFEKFENAGEFLAKSDYNPYLTIFYLFTLFEKKLQEQNIQFEKGIKKFAPFRIYIIVEETKYGKRTIFFEPYYLKSVKKLGFLVDYKFLKNPDIKFSKEIQKLSFSLDDNYRSNTGYHIDKYRYITNYLKQNLASFSSLTKDIIISESFEEIKCKQLKTKIYIFNGEKEHNSQFNGIMEYGPYEKIRNADLINYVYVFLEDHRDYVRDLIKALNGKSFNTFKGLGKLKMHVQIKENTIGVPIKSFDINPYDILNQNNIKKNSIIIAVFPEKEENFYYKLKNYCLQNNIPLQMVHLETIINENQLKWSVSGIALQMFAKLGGSPWIVKTNNTDCLIVGIGQAIERDAQDKAIRFFAYSVLFDASGRFLSIEPLAYSTDKNEYLSKIAENVSKILKEYSGYKKIVFHIPEKIKDKTTKKIEEILRTSNKNIELYIIRINDDSKFFGYDTNNNSLIPYESSYIKLSRKEFLLWTEGLNYHNPKPRKRYSNPIYIDFYYSNQSKIDFDLFLQDILNLSGANYRGFNAKSLPVSMFYPKLIASFYKHFNGLNLQTKIEKRDKPWFL